MEKRRLRRPFFVVNPKSYLYGQDVLDLAKVADDLAKKYDFDVLFTAQAVDLAAVKKISDKLIVTAQHMDGIVPGRGMGHVLPEALKANGVEATFLNHAECQRSFNELSASLKRADELGIVTIVCSNTLTDAKALAEFKPDIMVCELNELIGTGKTADASYMQGTNEAVKAVSPQTQVLQAAGISTPEDVYNAIKYGADGTGGTSGIVCAADPKQTLIDMFAALDRARTDFCK